MSLEHKKLELFNDLLNTINSLEIPIVDFVEQTDETLFTFFGLLCIENEELPEDLRKKLNFDNIDINEIKNIFDDISINIKSIAKDFDNYSGIVTKKLIEKGYFSNPIFKISKIKSKETELFEIIDTYYRWRYIIPFIDDKPNVISNIVDILCDKNPVEGLIILSYLIEFIKDELDMSITEDIYDVILMISIKFISNISNNSTNVLDVVMSKLSKAKSELKKTKVERTEANGVIKQLKNENKMLLNELKLKLSGGAEKVAKEIKIELKDSIKEFKNTNYETLKKTYENILNKANNDISELKSNIKIANLKLKEMENKLNSLTVDIKEEYIIDYLIKNDISNTGKNKIFKILSLSNIEDYKESSMNTDLKDDLITNKSIDKEKPKNFIKIGYVTIENEDFYVNFPSGEKSEIFNIPNNRYLMKGQFISIDNSNNYIRAYLQICNPSDLHYNSILAQTRILDNQAFVNIDGELHKVKTNNPSQILKDNQVIIIDCNYNVRRLFKSLKFNADNFIDSIRAKKHKAYYITKKIDNSFIMRDIEEDKEYIKQFSDSDIELNEENILILNENEEIVTVFQNSKFYTCSSYYTKGAYGVLQFNNDNFLFKNIQTGELKIIYDVPSHCSEGIVVLVDEFNRFVSEVTETTIIETGTKKFTLKVNKVYSDKKETEIVGKVLIVGNKKLENAYKLASFKMGYLATVIDGYENYKRITQEAKDVNKIVVIQNFVSHDNMFRLKKNYNNVIYSEFDGANRVAEQLTGTK